MTTRDQHSVKLSYCVQHQMALEGDDLQQQWPVAGCASFWNLKLSGDISRACSATLCQFMIFVWTEQKNPKLTRNIKTFFCFHWMVRLVCLSAHIIIGTWAISNFCYGGGQLSISLTNIRQSDHHKKRLAWFTDLGAPGYDSLVLLYGCKVRQLIRVMAHAKNNRTETGRDGSHWPFTGTLMT